MSKLFKTLFIIALFTMFLSGVLLLPFGSMYPIVLYTFVVSSLYIMIYSFTTAINESPRIR